MQHLGTLRPVTLRTFVFLAFFCSPACNIELHYSHQPSRTFSTDKPELGTKTEKKSKPLRSLYNFGSVFLEMGMVKYTKLTENIASVRRVSLYCDIRIDTYT